MPAPALYPHNPSIQQWPVAIPLSRDTQHQGLCAKSSSEVSQTDQRDKQGQFSLLWKSQPSTPVHTHTSPSSAILRDHLGEVGLCSDSPCLVPPLSSDHFTCLGRVIPVAQHDAVATDQKLPRSVQRHSLPCFWIRDFCLEEKKGSVRHQGGWSGVCCRAEHLEHVGKVMVTSVWGKMYPTVSVLRSMLSLGNPMKVTGLFSVVP